MDIFKQFGVTSWEPLVANLIAFVLMVLMLKFFAFKPIQRMLEKRRERIAEGEAMREESERQLENVQEQSKEILQVASEKGKSEIEDAKRVAADMMERQEALANARGSEILEKARESAALEKQEAMNALKGQFAQLVALATSQVTGKVLTEDDQRRINQEAIDSIDS